MARIIICGGGTTGLCAGTMLARDGHDVMLLEADAADVPGTAGDAWSAWDRPGVSQFNQPHGFLARFRQVCDEELPGLTDRLLAAGCIGFDLVHADAFPPGIADKTPRPVDHALRQVTGRRPVVESVVAQMAAAEPNLSIRRGVRARELITGLSAIPGVPHITGVRLISGEDIRADLVVDAMGRRSPGPQWIVEAGGQAPVEVTENSKFTYYTQFFTGKTPPRRIGPAITPMGVFSILTLLSDNDTWSITLYAPAGHQALRALRDPAVFQRVVAACPRQAHWLDGTPMTSIVPMAGIGDRYRRFVRDGQPVATGFVAVGDASTCTNPAAGRGVSLGLIHAQVLRRTARNHLGDIAAFASAYDAETESEVVPFYRDQLAADRARMAQINALLEGRPMPEPDPVMSKFFAAAYEDADVFRAMLESLMCLTPLAEVLARPYVRAKMAEYKEPVPPPPPAIDRERLFDLLAA